MEVSRESGNCSKIRKGLHCIKQRAGLLRFITLIDKLNMGNHSKPEHLGELLASWKVVTKFLMVSMEQQFHPCSPCIITWWLNKNQLLFTRNVQTFS